MAKYEICKISEKQFEISNEDLEFYERLNIPSPTLCPDERTRRRFAFRNERNLFYRKSDLSGEKILTCYHPDEDIKVYSQKEWWSDKWDAMDYARDYDFSLRHGVAGRSFFEQYGELFRAVPFIAMHEYNNQNSSYTNYTAECKNCFMISGPICSEDCLYGSPYYSKDCLDTLLVRHCELCYECITCDECYKCFYCQDCVNSNFLIYCHECRGCEECVGCVGLRNKKHCIFNKQYSKEEYLKFLDSINWYEVEQSFEKLKLKTPHRSSVILNCENCTGNYIYESKNTHDSYDVKKCWDCKYLAQTVDLKDCYDCNYVEENELCCEYLGFYKNMRTQFSLICTLCNDCQYCSYCMSCKDCFGCVGLRHKQYCIFNKQYSHEEYEELMARIIEHMKNAGEYGEFFPIDMSVFCYNETVAQEYFPFTKEEALVRGYRWREKDLKEYQPAHDDVLACDSCGKNYKLQPAEVKFYEKWDLPVPRTCPDCRHRKRLLGRPRREMFLRQCDNCEADINTTYSTNFNGVVYCEKCYLNKIK